MALFRKKDDGAPSFLRVMANEIKHDKLALISFFLFTGIMAFVFVAAQFIDADAVKKVDLRLINKPPMPGYPLGTDPSGRSILNQMIVGARNSLAIAWLVTLLTEGLGMLIGLVAGYYGGHTDNAIMRVLDFLMMLPRLMLIIVVVSIIPTYNVITFVLIMSALGWMYTSRLIRSKTLQQGGLDYVSAAKTLGSSNLSIMFKQVLPNISSIVIVDFTLTLAANMGLEVGLTFLGWGLPFNTPSLGTLIYYGSSLEDMQRRTWQWLPAALLILVLMLCINFVGHAIKRAADAKQRVA